MCPFLLKLKWIVKYLNLVVFEIKAVFLDRDGTIGGTGGGMHPFEFTLYDFAPSSIRRLNKLGVKVFLLPIRLE